MTLRSIPLGSSAIVLPRTTAANGDPCQPLINGPSDRSLIVIPLNFDLLALPFNPINRFFRRSFKGGRKVADGPGFVGFFCLVYLITVHQKRCVY